MACWVKVFKTRNTFTQQQLGNNKEQQLEQVQNEYGAVLVALLVFGTKGRVITFRRESESGVFSANNKVEGGLVRLAIWGLGRELMRKLVFLNCRLISS